MLGWVLGNLSESEGPYLTWDLKAFGRGGDYKRVKRGGMGISRAGLVSGAVI